MRRTAAFVVVLMVTAACSDSASSTTTTEPPPATSTVPATSAAVTTTTVPAPTTTLPEVFEGLVTGLSVGPCEGIGPAPPFGDWEITFVRDGKLWAVGSEGGEARCLGDAASFPQQWSPGGDRILTMGAPDLWGAALDQSGALPLAIPTRFEGSSWTRPTGTSVVGIDGDNRLVKYPIDGDDPVDLSFLTRHDEVRYHPAGTHVLVVGESAAGEYGIWLATNLGTEPELLVTASDGVTVSDPVVTQDGLFLNFVADHGDVSHLHQLALFDGSANEFDATIALESSEVLQRVVTSPWSGETVVSEGVCGSGMRTVVAWSGEVLLPEMESTPVGFLPDDNSVVLVAAWDGVCRSDVAPDLYLVSTFGGSPPQLVVRGADQFALPGIRSPLPGPPPPPGEFDFSGFA